MSTFADLQQGSASLSAAASLRWSAASHATLSARGSISAQSKRILSGGVNKVVDGQSQPAAVASITAPARVTKYLSASLAAAATFRHGEGSSVSFEMLETLASDHPYASASASMEALTSYSHDIIGPPSYSVSSASLVGLYGDGEMLTGEIGQSTGTLYGLRWLSSNKPYAGSERADHAPTESNIGYLLGFANDGLGPLEVLWREYVGFYCDVFARGETTGSIVASLTVTPTMVAARELIADVMSSADITGTIRSLSEYGANIIVTVLIDNAVAGEPVFVTWVLNAKTGAASMYEGFEFTSFFIHEGVHYGVTADGIFTLSGDDDDGTDIDAYLLTGKDDFGDSKLKRVPYVYAGAKAPDGLTLKTHTDDDEENKYSFEAGDTLGNLRAKIGMGLRSRYWQFEIRNVAGGSFTIETVEPLPTLQDRRLK